MLCVNKIKRQVICMHICSIFIVGKKFLLKFLEILDENKFIDIFLAVAKISQLTTMIHVGT